MRPNKYGDLTIAQSIKPQAVTATANGSSVDTLGYGAVTALLSAGVITDGTHAVKLQDSDDNSKFADVTGAIFANLTSAESNSVQRLGYTGFKRYVRAVTTVTEATAGGIYAVDILLSEPTNAPLS